MQKTKANLVEVPETMLWTLHNRANEAMRPNSIIKDDKCVEIYQSINYDYYRSFGPAEPSHASRSITFD
ncbi:MAG: class I SAM-dependent methyltransferase, partial [Bacteroidota bacterium]